MLNPTSDQQTTRKAGAQVNSIAVIVHSFDHTLQRLTFTFLILLAVLSVNALAQEYAQWGLPEGVKRCIGRGAMKDLAYSPDGTRLAIASSIGIWLYDTATLKEVALLTNLRGRWYAWHTVSGRQLACQCK